MDILNPPGSRHGRDRRSFLRSSLLGSAATLLAAAAGRGQEARNDRARLRLKAVSADGSLLVTCDERPLTQYRLTVTPGPEGTPPLFARSGYFHPLHAPNGAVVTGDFPADHPHQRGAFFAWTRTRLDLGDRSLEPDFWNLGSGTGRIVSRNARARVEAGVALRLDTEQLWEARDGEAWRPALEERWTAFFYPPEFTDPEADGAYFVFDLTARQRPLAPLHLIQHRYGGMALRGAGDWIPASGGLRVLASEGQDRVTADASRARWAAMFGAVEGRAAGVALLEHPENLGAPNRMRMHPEVPYFVFSPPQDTERLLEPNREHVFRFRIITFNGDVDRHFLATQWGDFAGV
jgi:hypothetical protein